MNSNSLLKELMAIRESVADQCATVRDNLLLPRLKEADDFVACALLENEIRRFVPQQFGVEDAFMRGMLEALEVPGPERRAQLIDLTSLFVVLAANGMSDAFHPVEP